MTPRRVSVLRSALVVVVTVIVGAVVVSIGRRPPVAPTASPSVEPSGTGSTATRFGDGVYARYQLGEQKFLLRYRTMVSQGQEEIHVKGIDEAEFSYVARGEPGRGTISADDCRYSPARQRAAFEGNVKLKTTDGFELETDALLYELEREAARADGPVTFRRKSVSGSATGLSYAAREGRIDLDSAVYLRIDDDARQSPAEIRSQRATVSRAEGTVTFEGDVRATRGVESLDAGRLEVSLSPEELVVQRAVAVENVRLDTGASLGQSGVTGTGGSGGRRELTCRKLDLWFNPDRSLRDAVATQDADLLIQPDPKGARERRRVRARVLVLRFDEAGRMTELQAQTDPKSPPASLEVQPLDAKSGPGSTASARNFVAQIDPATGAMRSIDFVKGFEYVRGAQRASSDRAILDGAAGLLKLSEGPRVADGSQGTELEAQTIDLRQGGDVQARGQVRHVMQNGLSRRGGPIGRGGESVLLASRTFDYEASTRTGRYAGSALLRSGRDEIRGAEIRVGEGQGGRRWIEAEGEVVTILYPKPKPEDTRPAAATEGRADRMTYSEESNRIHYSGSTRMRQGEIETTSPEATVALGRDGSAVETLVAGEPVEIRQGPRVANGQKATYWPATETVTIVGENVTLSDAEHKVQGARSLTFHVRDDRILVDGREETRPETIFRRGQVRP
jgi:lipopolysaccharide export system protein LptA